jgi:hypothetical protein
MKVFEIPKVTGTYADSLRAIGTADLLEEISGAQTIINDFGTHFQIECSTDIISNHLNNPSPGYYYIWRKSKEKENPNGILVLDYEEEKSKADIIKKNHSKRKSATITNALDEQGIVELDTLHPEYRPAAILESMRKGWSSDKDIYRFITQSPADSIKWITAELLKGAEFAAPIAVSNSQFFNPASGKGVHTTKTQYKSPSAISDQVVEPFAEWMKYRGAYKAMLTYRTDDDFKLFVIEPANISPRGIAVLRNDLMKLNLWGGIKLDIEASLRLAEALIMHSDVVQGEIGLRGRKPSQVVRGLRQAFFKSMGTAAALMNDAFLPLPGWFKIENRDDANAFLGVIEEHMSCLSPLYEKPPQKPNPYSKDIPILQQYRVWLLTNDELSLLDFLVRFAVRIMEKRSNAEWIREFSSQNLDILFIRGYGMREIVENAGFLNIANAIRNSTVSSFGNQKSGWKGSGFETQFGMAQEWKQKIKGGKIVFIPILSEFIQKHNWEAVHKLKKASPPVSQEDLNSVMQLIEQHGAELVGMLLLAYGYARAPKVENENTINKEGK